MPLGTCNGFADELGGYAMLSIWLSVQGSVLLLVGLLYLKYCRVIEYTRSSCADGDVCE